MAKKTKKLSLKRETLRTLDSDQLHNVAGGYGSEVAAGGLKGPIVTGTGPTKTDTFSAIQFEAPVIKGY